MKYNNETKDEIQIGDSLNVGESKSVYIKISYKEEMTSLPENDVAINDIYAEIIYGQKGSSSEEEEPTPTSICTSTNGTVSYALGTSYTCNVGDGPRTFYVLEDNGDSVSLIMNENIGSTVAWITQEDYEAAGGTQWSSNTDRNSFGPITVNNYLKEQTSSWTVEATLPTGQQIADAVGNTSWPSGGSYISLSSAPWLYSNLNSDGYWTSTPYSSNSVSAWLVRYHGDLGPGNVDFASDGVRPVITVSKSQLS